MNKELKLIEIMIMGHNSILGCIFKEYGYDAVENRNKYSWLFMVNKEEFVTAEQECEKLGLEDYIIFERRSAIVKNFK